MIDKRDYSLLGYNTFGIDVKAARFVEYSTVAEFQYFLSANNLGNSYLHIGRGSNLLFTCDYPGTVLHSGIKGVEVIGERNDEVFVRVGAGEIWDEWVDYCVSHQWYGVENLSLIPGEVGAAAVQNIGAYGVEAENVIQSVNTLNEKGEERTFSVDECSYSYRNSIFKHPEMKNRFVTYVTFHLQKNEHYKLDYGSVRSELAKYPKIDLTTVREAIIAIRRNKLPDPKITGNAGSFFMNPIVERGRFDVLQKRFPSMPFYEVDKDKVKIPAGWMVEQCGWKGKSFGKVAVHDKQALVLINLGGASGADVLALSDAIRRDVYRMFGIEIRPEVNFI